MALINYITQVNLDFGAISTLRAECERVGMRKPLIVTDAGVRAAGVLDRALAALGDHPYAVFDQTPSNPTEAAVRAAVALLKQEGCDGLIGVGGGSSLDLAKGVCIAATHPGPPTPTKRWCGHHAEDNHIVYGKGNQGRPDRHPAYIILGAVDRVDNPLPAGMARHPELLTEDRVMWALLVE